jgi:hypothetical protein
MRRRRLRTAFGTVALVVFALVGGAANYVWVNGSPVAPEGAAGGTPAPVATTAPVAATAPALVPEEPAAPAPDPALAPAVEP